MSLADLEAVVGSVQHALVVTDSEGNVLSMNPAALALHGFASIEECLESLREDPDLLEVRDRDGRLIPADDRTVARAVRGELVTDLELHGRRRDTGKSWVGLYGARRLSVAGSRHLFLMTIRDVTEHRRAEERTRQQNAVLAGMARIFQGALTCQTERDLGLACLAVVEEVTQSKFSFLLEVNDQTGLADIAISDPGWEACQVQDRSGHGKRARVGFEIHGVYGRVILDGKSSFTNAPHSHPASIGTPPGHPPLEAFLGVPLLHAGETIGMVGLGNREGGYGSEDLEAAEALAPAIVQAFLSKRAEEALRAANVQLTEAERRKNEFLAVLSHELRNPLAPIRNSLYLLDHAPPGGDQAAHARAVMNRQVDHLTRLVDDLLDVTRISHGKIDLHRELIDVREVVRCSFEDHRSMFDQRGIALRVEAHAGPVWIDADETRISQVVGNLLQNAAKFTHPGGAVSVSLAAVADRVEICVRDNGVGIEAELVPQVFEPFVQSERSLARTHGGLGLGLALVRGLVELHGGSVRAQSWGPNRGSELAVTLPIAAEPRHVARDSASTTAPTACRVLIIEDNVDAGQTLAEVLEMEGHCVHLATDGATGIRMARELKPDVVLCDIGLPDLSGCEVARALRADESLRATRLIAVTGYAQPEDRQRAVAAGFDAHVGKPAPIEEIAALVSKGR
jgi:PAS domain S-box-containing protein